MSRIHRALTLTLLLTLLALPASAVTSTRANQNSSWGFLSVLWNTVTSFFAQDTTDGRCSADPDGRCHSGDAPSQTATDARCGLDPDGLCRSGDAPSQRATDGRCALDPGGICLPDQG